MLPILRWKVFVGDGWDKNWSLIKRDRFASQLIGSVRLESIRTNDQNSQDLQNNRCAVSTGQADPPMPESINVRHGWLRVSVALLEMIVGTMLCCPSPSADLSLQSIASVELKTGQHFIRIRQLIRRALIEDGIGQKIEKLAEQALAALA